MAEPIKNKYIIRVDKVCSNCGYRNVLNQILDDEISIIACGSCGKFIMTPEDMTTEDKEIVIKIINKAMEEAK
jgi:ribosomal protein S27AE